MSGMLDDVEIVDWIYMLGDVMVFIKCEFWCFLVVEMEMLIQ